jgi:uncharacterized lipoprotein YmbA
MVTTLPRYVKRTAVLSLLATSACSATPPTDFYVLTSLADAETQAIAQLESGPLVGVGPIELPSYLDQPAITTRASANTVTMADFDHWAEPLPDGFTRVLAENLAHLAPAASIAIFPWTRAEAPDIQVIARVIRFEVAADQALVLAEWRLVTPDRGEILSKRSSFTEPVLGGSTTDTVSAMSGAVTQLSKEISEAIEAQAGGK